MADLQAHEREELKGLLERVALPWAYRPERFDDWGFIRAPEKHSDLIGPYKPIVAMARDSDVTEADMARHREAKTDPYEPFGRLIVAAVNALPSLLATVEALERENARWKQQSDDWQKRGWELGLALDAAEAQLSTAQALIREAVEVLERITAHPSKGMDWVHEIAAAFLHKLQEQL